MLLEIIINKKPSIIERIYEEELYLKSDRYEKDKKYWEENLEDIQVKTILKRRNKY